MATVNGSTAYIEQFFHIIFDSRVNYISLHNKIIVDDRSFFMHKVINTTKCPSTIKYVLRLLFFKKCPYTLLV